MKITIVGTGYVGLVTGTCFSEVGIDVTCIDIDQKKIEGLKNGVMPIYEPGLEPMVMRNLEKGRLHFSTSLKDSIHDSEAVFIAVGTPPGEDGSADLKYVLAVAREIGAHMNDYLVVVTKSTVPCLLFLFLPSFYNPSFSLSFSKPNKTPDDCKL